MTLNIIVDTREKKDFFKFLSYGDIKLEVKALKTGDYSLVGHEDKITIDRKRDCNELQMCLGQSWKRFYKELQRMSSFEEAYIVCAFPYENVETFPVNSGIPKGRWRFLKTGAKFLKKRIHDIEEEFPNIKFIFSYSTIEAEEISYNLLRTYYDKQINPIE
jgi:hypothetical protein